MVKIFPFVALRPKKEYVVDFSTNAYETSANLPVDESKFSYQQIVQPESYFKKAMPPEEALQYAKEKLEEFLKKSVLQEEEYPSIYIYEQVKDDHVFRGFIAGASVEDYEIGKIKRHELTRTQKEDQITEYFMKLGINGSPVLLTYPKEEALENLLHEGRQHRSPVYDFTDEMGIHHGLWLLGKEEAQQVQSLFRPVEAIYIADGHHRCAAAARAAKELQNSGFASFMAFLIAGSNLSIYSYNRLIENLGGISVQDFLEKLRADFEVEEVAESQAAPQAGKSFALYMEYKWYRLRLKNEIPQASSYKQNLDVCILENHILGPLLGITDSRTDSRISFMDGAAGIQALVNKVDSGEAKAAFALHPASIEDIFIISDTNETMPPKSTWVEPKLRSGLLLHKLSQ
ncbi:MAG: DUF1015 family protein [Bacteroidia bacterium]